MNENRYIFRHVLGLIGKTVLIAALIYGVMWAAVWISGFLTAGTVTLLFMALIAGMIYWMWWDSRHCAERKGGGRNG